MEGWARKKKFPLAYVDNKKHCLCLPSYYVPSWSGNIKIDAWTILSKVVPGRSTKTLLKI